MKTVIESKGNTSVIELVSNKALKGRLTNLSKNSKANTLSLAYYTMIHGNPTALSSCDSSISKLLDPTYRQFICAKFDTKESKWVHSKTRGMNLIASLGLEFSKSTFAEFVDAVEAHADTLAAKKLEKEAEAKALDPVTKLNKDKERVTKYLVNCGLTTLQLKDIVLALEHEKSVQAAKSIQTTTAA